MPPEQKLQAHRRLLCCRAKLQTWTEDGSWHTTKSVVIKHTYARSAIVDLKRGDSWEEDLEHKGTCARTKAPGFT